jgi:hypothetical protein
MYDIEVLDISGTKGGISYKKRIKSAETMKIKTKEICVQAYTNLRDGKNLD